MIAQGIALFQDYIVIASKDLIKIISISERTTKSLAFDSEDGEFLYMFTNYVDQTDN